MSLIEWQKNGWLRIHKSSYSEIKNLLDIIERDLKDANADGLSDDWKFGIAYNASLKLCTILLYASGFRAEKNLAHYRTLQALPLILGKHRDQDAIYLDVCRKKRNETEYDFAGRVTEDEAKELINFCIELKAEVKAWLKKNHKEFVKSNA